MTPELPAISPPIENTELLEVRQRGLLDAGKRREIVAILSLGCSRATAAQYVGCHAATITRTAKRDPGVRPASSASRVSCSKSQTSGETSIRPPRMHVIGGPRLGLALERKFPDPLGTATHARPFRLEQVSHALQQFAQLVIEEVKDDDTRELTFSIGWMNSWPNSATTIPRRMTMTSKTVLRESRNLRRLWAREVRGLMSGDRPAAVRSCRIACWIGVGSICRGISTGHRRECIAGWPNGLMSRPSSRRDETERDRPARRREVDSRHACLRSQGRAGRKRALCLDRFRHAEPGFCGHLDNVKLELIENKDLADRYFVAARQDEEVRSGGPRRLPVQLSNHVRIEALWRRPAGSRPPAGGADRLA